MRYRPPRSEKYTGNLASRWTEIPLQLYPFGGELCPFAYIIALRCPLKADAKSARSYENVDYHAKALGRLQD